MSISVTDLMKKENVNIIDIRARESYNNNHLPGAKNISQNELLIMPEKYLNKTEIYYIYCQHGYASKKLCQILNIKGFNTVNVIGGYEAYVLSKYY